MCDWRKGERTFMGHLWYCYPAATRYMCLVMTLLLLVQILDFLSERGWF